MCLTRRRSAIGIVEIERQPPGQGFNQRLAALFYSLGTWRETSSVDRCRKQATAVRVRFMVLWETRRKEGGEGSSPELSIWGSLTNRANSPTIGQVAELRDHTS